MKNLLSGTARREGAGKDRTVSLLRTLTVVKVRALFIIFPESFRDRQVLGLLIANKRRDVFYT